MALNEGAIGRPHVPQTVMGGFRLEGAPPGQLRSNGDEMAGFYFSSSSPPPPPSSSF